jgi:CubicO group peptidase (beta-lactamase class C family)
VTARRPVLACAAVVLLAAFFPHRGWAQSVPPDGLPRARPEDVGLSSAALRRIAPVLKLYVDSGRLAGIAAAVSRQGRLVYLETVGSMDSARQTPMRADAVFRIYSMTKPVTTVAVMQLVERGRLRLDDPVSKYIPSFAGAKVYTGGGMRAPVLRAVRAPVTIAHLLTHSAGLTYGVFGNTAVDSMYRNARLDRPELTIAQLADSLARLPLLFEPGTRWNYSLAIDVLGRVVEAASGKPLDRYFEEEIFAPLGMRSTAFHATPSMNGRITALFSAGRGGGLRSAPSLLAPIYEPEAKLLLGGQGLLSTIPDYLRFAQMLLNGGELDGHRVLKRETVAAMMRDQLPAGVTYGGGYAFGFGGSVQIDSGATFVSAPGTYQWGGFATTAFWIDPRSQIIGMVWAQRIPTLGLLERDFKRLVYAAVTR